MESYRLWVTILILAALITTLVFVTDHTGWIEGNMLFLLPLVGIILYFILGRKRADAKTIFGKVSVIGKKKHWLKIAIVAIAIIISYFFLKSYL